jgi:alpha-1,2-mannosyltransferase
VWAPAAVLALLAGHLAFSVWPALLHIRNDFPSYYLSARAALEGRPLGGAYERAFWTSESARAGLPTAGTFVPHPPPNALLLLPVAGLGPAAAKAAWSGALALMLLGSFSALRRVVPDATPWLAALALLAQTASLRNALLYGQPYPLLLLLLCLSLVALLRRRALLCGLLLAPLVALKLYGAPFVLFLLVTRRWRALMGVIAGVAALAALSVAVLGPEIHRVYLSQVLRESLDGRILDPYSTVWGSAASVARRLLQHEPELNPYSLADAPVLARGLGRGTGLAIAVFAVAAAVGRDRQGRLRLAWATLTVGSLAASPLPSSYHMVLLALPAAILLVEGREACVRPAALGLAALAGSPLVHHLAPLAQGWGNLVAPVRLVALLALLWICVRGASVRRPVAFALAAGATAGLTALIVRPEDPGWQHLGEARGVIVAEPAACADGLSWLVLAGERYRYRRGDGSLVDEPPCAARTASADGEWLVRAERSQGSWDIWGVNRRTGEKRRVTRDPANEVEPAWLPGDDAIVFASDRRRGLGATTLFVVPFDRSERPRRR